MCRSTWEVTGGLYGSFLSSQAWGFSKGIWCGRLAKCPVSGLLPCGQSVLSPVAPRWPVQSFSSPEVVTTAWFRKRGRVCVKELCVGREIGKNNVDLQRSLSIVLHFAHSFLLPSRRLQLTLCPLPLTS